MQQVIKDDNFVLGVIVLLQEVFKDLRLITQEMDNVTATYLQDWFEEELSIATVHQVVNFLHHE